MIKYKQYKNQKGLKGFLARMASPCLGFLKKILPSNIEEKSLYDCIGDGSKLQAFFERLLRDQESRSQFEEELRKFLTGNYDFDEFQEDIQESMGIKIDRLALEAYNEFSSIFYDQDILNKIIELSQMSQDVKNEINQLRFHFLKTQAKVLQKIQELHEQFLNSSGLC